MTNTPAEQAQLPNQAELAELADIVEVSELPFTGIAPGWWVLAALVLLLLAALGYWLYQRRQRSKYNQALQEARQALNSIDIQQPDAAQQINILLKRLVRHYSPNSALLSCPLPVWQEFLQQQQPRLLLPNLTVLLYQAEADPQQTASFADFAKAWLQPYDARKLANSIKEHTHA